MNTKRIAVMIAGILLKGAAVYAQEFFSAGRNNGPASAAAGWAPAAISLPQPAIGAGLREGIGRLQLPGQPLSPALTSPVAETAAQPAPQLSVPVLAPALRALAPGYGKGAAFELDRMGDAVQTMRDSLAVSADEAAVRMEELFDDGIPAIPAALSAPAAEASPCQPPRLNGDIGVGDAAASPASRGGRTPSPLSGPSPEGKKKSFLGALIPTATILVGAVLTSMGLPLSAHLGSASLQMIVFGASLLAGVSMTCLGIVMLGKCYVLRVTLDDETMRVPTGMPLPLISERRIIHD